MPFFNSYGIVRKERLNKPEEPEVGKKKELYIKAMECLKKHDFVCPVLGKCNIVKNMEEKKEYCRREYEAFTNMHCIDGTFTESSSARKL